VTQAIELRIPSERPFHGVARLVVGGLAARHNLSYEALEDLQLALVTILESDGYAAAGEIRVEVEVTDEAITMAIGPLNGDTVRADLQQSSEGDLGLGRLLGTLVEDATVDAREDGDWLRLSKRVRGIKPAGTNA
jgi:anti-sigma regulatory factor (Ser/Thr protein kinase)